MRPDVPEPEYVPEPARAWAREHRELLEMIAEELLQTGSWPSVKALTRRLARERRPVALSSLLWTMPKPLGFVENYPDRVVLLVFGLRMTHAGHKLLAGFFAMLRLAVERYAGAGEQPVLTRADAAHGTVPDDPYVQALGEIVLREAPFIGSGTGGAEDDWRREITDGVVRYWDAHRVEDYLRIRAGELSASPQLGWQPRILDSSPLLTSAPDLLAPHTDRPRTSVPGGVELADALEVRDAFLSHAGEDEDIARSLATALHARGRSVWYDEAELVVGDSLSDQIDHGLTRSRFGVVILSRAFFAKSWPRRELEGLVAREMTGGQRLILPVWHEIDQHYLVKVAPPLADRLAANTAHGVDHVADEVSRAIKRRGLGPALSGDQPTG